MRRCGGIAAFAVLLMLAAPGFAQPRHEPQATATNQPPPATAPQRPAVPAPLPAATTSHSLALPGRTLHFTATVGAIRLTDAQGQPQADIGFTAYVLDGADAATRPVTFAINGGPGAGSVWLQLGALGPWRLPMDAITPSTPPVIVPNAETWLDFTDLVFLDPPGTGYGRILASGEAAQKHFWSVDGDLDALAETIRRWLVQNNRMGSPKAIAGESYGGFRAPRLARLLPTTQGVAVSALVLISPALDMGTLGRRDALSDAALLPSMAAANGGLADRAGLADAEAYARGEFITDRLRGPRDAAALDRLTARVAALTGLDTALVRRLGGSISARTFLHEHDRAAHDVASAYDATVSDPDPFADSLISNPPDPLLDGLQAPLGSAITDLDSRLLDFHPPGHYEVLNERVAHAWDFGRHPPEAIDALRTDLAFDTKLRVVVVQGLTDLVVPYFGTQLLLDQLPRIGPPGRVTLTVLPGGHMFYIRDASRAALRAAAERVIAPH
jgi:carboxypeptidase C (cathepsin A)